MNEEQIRRLEDCPVSWRGILRRAYQKKGPPRNAIKAFCVQCVGYNRADVANCTALGCPLWPYRPYQKGAEDENEDVEPGAAPA